MADLPEKVNYDQQELNSRDTFLTVAENAGFFADAAVQYQELMMMYDCAIKEVRTKLEVLNSELSVRYNRNPIEFISCRIKKPASIVRKLKKRNLPITLASLEENISDIAGIRVICSFIDDIYAIASMLTRQDDITLVEEKDYIQHPKANGYRSLHLIVQIPVFFSDVTKHMKVEIQIRTIAMDFWASLEHQLKYKKDLGGNEEKIMQELYECAQTISATDEKMLAIRKEIEETHPDFEGKTTDPLAALEKLNVPLP